MATGFQVINDNGILQIDEFFRNMVLIQKGTATTTRPSGSGVEPYFSASYFRVSYPVSSRQPLMAVRCNSPANGRGVTFITDDNGFTFYSQGDLTFEYFIYDRIDFGNASGNTGLQVFNAQGVEVFNSNNNYMKVLGSYDTNVGPPQTSATGNQNPYIEGYVTTGRRVAVAPGVQSTGWYQVITGGSGQPGSPGALVVRWWQTQIANIADSHYRVTNGLINILSGVVPGTPSESGIIASYNSGLLIDVTGL